MTDKIVRTFPELRQAVGNGLRQLRIEAGCQSARDFADQHGLAINSYTKIEEGANITLKSLHRILEIHRLDVADFFAMTTVLIRDKS